MSEADRFENAWEKLFDELSILNEIHRKGYFDLFASQIKIVTGEEPRLMTKIDFREHLPSIMAEEGLGILSISNGVYRIGKFDPFIEIKTNVIAKPVAVEFPQNIVTIDPRNFAGESSVLDAALITGIFERVFGECVVLTIRGRRRSPRFDFSLGRFVFPVSGVQIEVDGGYEGVGTINLVEAKIGARSNLSIRQLVYPKRAWEILSGKKKEVRLFVCFYQEPVLRIIPIDFVDGILFANHCFEQAFVFETISKFDLYSIPIGNPRDEERDIPFPQADRFETIMAMFNIIAQRESVTKFDLLAEFDITRRQIDYYVNALCWIGLVKKVSSWDVPIGLTDWGTYVSYLSFTEKMQAIAQVIFKNPVFNFVLRHENEEVPQELFLAHSRELYSLTTQRRRVQTVRAWVKYFKRIFGC